MLPHLRWAAGEKVRATASASVIRRLHVWAAAARRCVRTARSPFPFPTRRSGDGRFVRQLRNPTLSEDLRWPPAKLTGRYSAAGRRASGQLHYRRAAQRAVARPAHHFTPRKIEILEQCFQLCYRSRMGDQAGGRNGVPSAAPNDVIESSRNTVRRRRMRDEELSFTGRRSAFVPLRLCVALLTSLRSFSGAIMGGNAKRWSSPICQNGFSITCGVGFAPAKHLGSARRNSRINLHLLFVGN